MNRILGGALFLVIYSWVHIQAQNLQVVQDDSPIRRGVTNRYPTSYEYSSTYGFYNAYLLQPQGTPFRSSNTQLLPQGPSPGIISKVAQRVASRLGQPEEYNYQTYQPIPTFDGTNYNNPTNEQELSQYKPAPKPIIRSPPKIATTTTPSPYVQTTQNESNNDGIVYPNYPPYQEPNLLSAQYPQRPSIPNQTIQPNPSYQSNSNPTIQSNSYRPNQNGNSYEFITHFSWSLFQNTQRLIASESNNIICPLSVQLLLTLVERASAGNTKRQLQNIIGSSDPIDIGQAVSTISFTRSKNRLKIGTAMFPSQRLHLNESFVEVARSSLVDVIPIDYNNQRKAQNDINSWAAASTDNKIENIFSGTSVNVELLLTNAIYFEGAWKYPFNKTINGIFYHNRNNQQKEVTYLKQSVNLMSGKQELGNLKFTWVELPYENDDFSMVLMLPNDFKLDELINQVRSNFLTDFIRNIELGQKKRVHLRLPKFELRVRAQLKNTLHNMGIVDAFADTANIPYLATEKVKIDDAQQDVYLSVDEKGTTAAAVTSFSIITLSSTSYDPEEMEFDCNQPFLAVILHKQTGIPIFIAKIYDP